MFVDICIPPNDLAPSKPNDHCLISIIYYSKTYYALRTEILIGIYVRPLAVGRPTIFHP